MENIIKGRYVYNAIIAIQLALFFILLLNFAPYMPDDAYIYFNGARQLVGGNIPTIARGEKMPTNSFSSFLWLILLAPAFLLNIPPEIWAKILGVAFLGLSAIVFRAILLKFVVFKDNRQATICALTILLFPPFVANAVNGLETTMAMFSLLVLAFIIIRDYKAHRFSIWLGLAFSFYFLARPDSVANLLPAALFLLYAFLKKSMDRAGWWRFFIGLLPGIAGSAFLVGVYGDIIPTSATAKMDFLGLLLDPGFYKLAFLRFIWSLSPDPILFLILFSAVLLVVKNYRDPLFYLMIAFSFSLIVVRVSVIAWMGVHRLYVPSLVVALAMFYIFFKRILSDWAFTVFCILTSFCFLTSASYWNNFVALNYASPTWPPKELGGFIAAHKKRDSWLIQADMGAVPYFADIPTLDGNDRPICNRWLEKHPDDMDYVRDRNLDFVILAKKDIEGNSEVQYNLMKKIENSDWFKEHYRKVAIARWRQEIRVYRPSGENVEPGRYLHLYASDRINTLPKNRILILE